jgi:hypothetical protein
MVEDTPSREGGFQSWRHLERRVDEETVQVDMLRTSEVHDVVLKRYFFPLPEQRWKAALRHTWLIGKPKAQREAEALQRIHRAGLPIARPIGWAVQRDSLGFVLDSWLLSERLPGEDLQRRLSRGEMLPDAAWFAVGASAGLLHDGGVQHGGLAARNVIVAESDRNVGSGWTAAWVDPAKAEFLHRLGDFRRAAELLHFWAGLSDASPWARAAFAEGYGDPEVAEEERLWMRIPPQDRAVVEQRIKKETRRSR